MLFHYGIKNMRFILLSFSILLSFNCFSQSDTIPDPDIEVLLGTTRDRKDGPIIIDYVPSSISVRARGNKEFCNNYPRECRYQVSKLEICILDKKGLVKFKTQSEVGETKELDIKHGDKIKINVFQVIRIT